MVGGQAAGRIVAFVFIALTVLGYVLYASQRC